MELRRLISCIVAVVMPAGIASCTVRLHWRPDDVTSRQETELRGAEMARLNKSLTKPATTRLTATKPPFGPVPADGSHHPGDSGSGVGKVLVGVITGLFIVIASTAYMQIRLKRLEQAVLRCAVTARLA